MTQFVFCRSSAFRENLKAERQQVSPKRLCVITILLVLINLKGATSNLLSSHVIATNFSPGPTFLAVSKLLIIHKYVLCCATCVLQYMYMYQVGVVVIMTRLWVVWPGVRIVVGATDFPLFQRVYTDTGARPASCSIGPVFFFLGREGKAAGT
jgi:hypothetical protein